MVLAKNAILTLSQFVTTELLHSAVTENIQEQIKTIVLSCRQNKMLIFIRSMQISTNDLKAN